MSNEIQESIRRAREAQRGWVDHMKSEGWHRCARCKNMPVKQGQKFCAMCECELRKRGRLKGAVALPEKKEVPDQPSLDFKPETPASNVTRLEKYREEKRKEA